MRIIVKFEEGRPILFFPDDVERDKSISCWRESEEHSSAQRAYMRALPDPATPEQRAQAWRVLARYAKHAEYVETR